MTSHAGKYSRSGSTVSISVSSGRGMVSIAIKDEGVGISKDDHKKLFQKFSRIDNEFSVQMGGSGLGLYWAKKIVELHEGTISVKSSRQKGSTFTIKLPQ